MIDYKAEYQKWLHSDAITEDERAELLSIAGDDKEIESRFYGPLEFGTAGLRGTMKMGLHQMMNLPCNSHDLILHRTKSKEL